MVYLIILFVVCWIWCTACEQVGEKASKAINKKIDQAYDNHKDTIKKGAREVKGALDLIYHMTSISRRFK